MVPHSAATFPDHGPWPSPHQRRDAQLVELLEERGLVEVYVNEEGQETYRLTEEGARVGHMLAIVEGQDAEQVLDAILSEPG